MGGGAGGGVFFCTIFKDTHRENASSNKTRALTKSMYMDIWVVGTLSQLFIRVLILKLSFLKSTIVSGKTPLFEIGPFYTPHSTGLNIGFWHNSFS